MTRKRAKELLPVLQAFVEGKTVQWKARERPDSKWQDLPLTGELSLGDCESHFNEYRIKPAPREWYIAVDKNDNDLMSGSNKPFTTNRSNWEVVKVVEVL